MNYTIKFVKDRNGRIIDPTVNDIREAARAERWTGIAGFKQWARETYRATLRTNKYYDWTSITFYTEQDLNRFKQRFGVE